jgi:hypothetical protein
VKHDVGVVILPPLIVGLLPIALILRRFLIICLLVAILVVEHSIALLTSSVIDSHYKDTASSPSLSQPKESAGNDKIVAPEVNFPVAGEASPRPCVTSGVPFLHRPLNPLHVDPTVLDNNS